MPALLALLLVASDTKNPSTLEMRADRPVLMRGVPFRLTIRSDAGFQGTVHLEGVRGLRTVDLKNGVCILERAVADGPISARAGNRVAKLDRRVLPPWLCFLPPIVAIALALLTRQVVVSLFMGVWTGALLLAEFEAFSLARSLAYSLDLVVVEAADPPHGILLLTLLLMGGWIGILAHGGTLKGLGDRFAPLIRTRRASMVSTWAMCLVLFFDDYANSLIAGTTMRPITDRFRVSREKLAYLVDSTAGPITALGLVSTWALLEERMLHTAFGGGVGAVVLHLHPYSFYTLFCLLLVFLVAWSGRDFGPMYAAEMRAITTGQVLDLRARPLIDRELADAMQVEDMKERWPTAAISIGALFVLTLAALVITGHRNPQRPAGADGLLQILEFAKPFRSFLYGAFGATAVAVAACVARRYLGLAQVVEAWFRGMKAMLVAVVILVLAWAMGQTCRDLSVGSFVAQGLEGWSAYSWLPAMAFILCAGISLSTGSALASLVLLLPILVPIARQHPEVGIQYGTLAAVLSGALFGDHLSPISDTTVVSSLGAASDHIDHVKTQFPYAILVGIVALGCGFIPAGKGLSVWICLAAGAAVLAAVVFAFGKKLPTVQEEEA